MLLFPRPRDAAGTLVLLIGLSSLDVSAGAAVQIRCRSDARYDPAGPDPEISDPADTGGSCASHLGEPLATLDSVGEADVGILHATSSGTFADGALERASTSANVSWRDQVRVDAEGLAGEIGVVHATVHLEGTLDITDAGEVSAQLSAVTPFATPQLLFEDCLPAGPCAGQFTYPAVIAESIDFVFNVQFGQDGLLGMSLATTAARPAVYTTPGAADSVFANTLTWGGIDSVTHQGNPVAYTVTSESGFDYTQPVPEAGATALLLAGGTVLSAAGRRRTRRSAEPSGNHG